MGQNWFFYDFISEIDNGAGPGPNDRTTKKREKGTFKIFGNASPGAQGIKLHSPLYKTELPPPSDAGHCHKNFFKSETVAAWQRHSRHAANLLRIIS